jgi:hypothetical protein
MGLALIDLRRQKYRLTNELSAQASAAGYLMQAPSGGLRLTAYPILATPTNVTVRQERFRSMCGSRALIGWGYC